MVAVWTTVSGQPLPPSAAPAVRSIAVADAAEFPFLQDQWTRDNGLPQNSVRALVQTRDGYLWIGTFGGLVRFDGVRFTVLNTLNTPALPSNRILSLHEDAGGTLWIGTEYGGLVGLKDGAFTRRLTAADGLVGDSVSKISPGRGGSVWAFSLWDAVAVREGRVATRLPRGG